MVSTGFGIPVQVTMPPVVPTTTGYGAPVRLTMPAADVSSVTGPGNPVKVRMPRTLVRYRTESGAIDVVVKYRTATGSVPLVPSSEVVVRTGDPLLGYAKTGATDEPGVPRDIIGTFMARDGWTDLEAGAYLYPVTGAGNEYPTWVGRHLDRAADVAVPLIPHNGVPGGEHNPAQSSSALVGRRDPVLGWSALLDEALTRPFTYVAMGRRLAELSPSTVIARLWWEYNQYAADVDPVKFVAAWRFAVPLIREGFAAAARPGQTLRIALCYMASNADRLETFYPGDDVVDVISADVYSGIYRATNPTLTEVRANITTQLDRLAELGRLYGKPIALGEYGLSPAGAAPTGDPAVDTFTRGTGDDKFAMLRFMNWLADPDVPVVSAVYFSITDGAGLALSATPVSRTEALAPYYATTTGLSPDDEAQPLPTITITAPVPVTPLRDTFYQETFDTPAGLSATRTTQVQPLSASVTAGPWYPAAPTPVTRIGGHTATYGGTGVGYPLTELTSYRGKRMLKFPGFQDYEQVFTFTTGAAPTPVEPPPVTPTVKYERWMYPADVRTMLETEGATMASGYKRAVLLNPGSTYPVPAGWLAFYGRTITHTADKLWVVCPEVIVNPLGTVSLQFEGIIQGCLVRWDRFIAGSGSSTQVPGAPLGNILVKDDGTRQTLRLGGGSKTTQYNYSSTQDTLKGGQIANAKAFDWSQTMAPGGFRAMEGCAVLPSELDGWVYFMEGIGYDGKNSTNDTLVINRCRLANGDGTQGNSWISGGGSVHFQGDIFQPINGPSKLYWLDSVNVTSYQGLFGQFDVFVGTGTADHQLQYVRRVTIRGDRGTTSRPGGQSSLWWDTTLAKTTVERDYGTGENGTFLDTVPGKTGNSVIYGGSTYTDDDALQIAAPPRDFAPLSEFVPWSPGDTRWSVSTPRVG